MAEIITSVLTSIVSALCNYSENTKCCYLFDLQENKDALNTAMEELRATRDGVKIKVDEAENNPNQERIPEVNNWLQRVQTIDDEVVQVIQKVDQEIEGRCFGANCPINCRSARKIGKLVIRELAIVKGHKSKGDSFGVVAYRLPPPLVQREPVDSTVGMESMFDKVWRLLAEDEVRVMGLYGYGGVGKTTLLKQINNEFLKTTTTTTSSSSSSSNLRGFDVVILVVVSKVINIDAIQKEIGSRLGLSSTEANETSIFNALTKKNFVLLLDDLWERVDLWERIGIPLGLENKKSKIVFTTRFEIVCGHMDANKKFRVECLQWDEAWTLFQEKVGNEALNSHPKVPELAKVVAKECGGLPLALITIGRAMSTRKTPQEWNHAITTLQKYASRFPAMGDIVLPRLKLSYDYLSDDTIRSCFIYCALFPEDHSIEIPELIDYWIGEGLISLNEFDHIDEARNHGYNVIGDLKSACLLESGKYEETQVKMHDVIRDLALWIAHESGSEREKVCMMQMRSSSCYNPERIYLHSSYSPHKIKTKPANLITLICHSLDFEGIFSGVLLESVLPQNFFRFTPLLRVLDLSGSRLETFPISITELVELRYLSLSRTRIQLLPEELGKLVKLKHLDLSHMMWLRKIPSGVIGSFVDLRVLNLLDSYEHWDIEEGHKLKHLDDFGITINIEYTSLTKLLSSSNENLQRCTRHLSLNSEDVDLQSTSLSSSSSPIITIEKLQLLFNLETLEVNLLQLIFFRARERERMALKADQLMNMVGKIEQQQHLGSCFQKLSEIVISHCNALKDLTWVGYVPNLKTLDVRYCEELEKIVVIVVDDSGGGSTAAAGGGGGGGGGGDEIISNVEDVFKSLKTLTLTNLPKLKSICRNALAFPCLESLVVLECPQLKKLPLDYGSNVNNTL